VSGREPVGLLGGTFDPIHRGHLEIARHVRERTGARIALLPSYAPPHKGRTALTPAGHREAMLRIAMREDPALELCRIELRSASVCYTIDTLRRIRRERPGVAPVFILGMDSLVDLPSWREPGALLEEFDLIVVDRPLGPARRIPEPIARRLVDLPAGAAGVQGWNQAAAGSGGRVFRIRMAPIPVSSTAVRRMAAAGRDLDALVPREVGRYILANRLYAQEEER
jgi:nicotinate-nucleotide adenylyltransferase